MAEILQNDKANQDRDSSSGGANTVTVGGDAPSDSVRCALAGWRLVQSLVPLTQRACFATGLRLLSFSGSRRHDEKD